MLPCKIARLPSWAALALAAWAFAAPALAQFPLAIDTSRILDAGHDHNVAVITSGANAGQVWAWGGNAGGKLGNGATINASIPVRVGKNAAGFSTLVAVAASQGNSYAIQGNGTLWAWGDQSDQLLAGGSRLGTGASAPHNCVFNGTAKPCAKSPVKVPIPETPGHPTPGTKKIVQVGAGWGHVVALRDDGTVWTWGGQSNNVELGQNASGALNLPTQVKGVGGTGFLVGITQIAVGYFHTLALRTDGSLVSWGRNDAGQLGNGTFTNSGLPVVISTIANVAAIRAKGSFSLARNTAGTLFAWGSNQYGQIGVGPATGVLSNVNVLTQILTGVASMEAGYSTAFAKLGNGSFVAWGLDSQLDPQLGIAAGTAPCNPSARPCVRIPSPLAAYNGAGSIVAGAAHTIVVRANQSLAIFGNNASGQLGNDTGGGGTFGTTFSQSNWDPDFTMTPLGVGGSGSSVGARSRIGGISLLALGAGIDFGPRPVNSGAGGAQTLTFENLDTVPISIGQISAPTDFATSGDTCSNTSVAANGACTFVVAFGPSQAGDRTNTLPISTSSINEVATIDVVVAGVGTTVPGAPTNVSAAAGTGQATITFSPPLSDGGSPIISYTAFSSPGSASASAGGAPITVSGLANGTTYTFTVSAANSAGSGALSTPSNGVTPQPGTVGLTVALAGSGAGTVTSVPAGIDCGAVCAAQFAFGTTVALSAAATPGASFAGWSGACTGTGACNLTMDATKGVTATFTAQPVSLTVVPAGLGSGIVSSTPAGIACGGTCSATFGFGSTVSLAQTAAAGSVFNGWSGACTGTGACSISMGAATSVTATFARSTSRKTDFNGDGKSDLLWRNDATGQVYRMFMNGFAIGGQALVYLEPNTAWKIIADADFNGDGVSDLLWRNDTTGQVYLSTFGADGMPSGGAIIYTEPNLAWKIVKVADFDGDGKADLLWWNSSTGQVYAMLMNGTTIVAQGMVYTEPNLAWKIAAVGDFSGSGKQNQLIWRNSSTGQVYLMTVNFANGGFTQVGQVFYSSQLPYKIVAAGDFNGDGKSDLLWRHDATGEIYLMLMNGAAITFEGVIYAEPNLAWKVVAAGDYNGDGKADILWRNYTTGQVYMMLMNGPAIAAQAMVYTEPNPSWKILGPLEYGP